MTVHDLVVLAVCLLAALWLAAVVFGLIARPLGLTGRRSAIGKLARFCRAVEFWSP